ncbi:hypothetical protein BGZ80_003131 [Entomortierella chlamydospora]|uniref:Protein kinase domain-containing protein n=1 Tax=Entomortierella chlamydospora TaxID=101097 RepID=A0A9P6T2V1_9FUNG|nr:hypothetical protein BGZ79_009102 [Entomortierella chlamydospora]KAG0021051.1 hypothetical protein BGZ80_003131 [Entomortierella chlamydospora]
MSALETPSDAWSLVGKSLPDQDRPQVSYHILDVLGYGTYGCIYLAKTSSTVPDFSPEYKAIKCLSKRGLSSTQLLIQRQEIDIHLSLSSANNGQHANVVDMSSVIETKDSLYLVMEYCSGGDLYDAITSQHAAAADSGMGFVAPALKIPGGRHLNVHSDNSVLDAMEQILSAVTHAHKHQVFHRDLKPENILVACDGSLKLADFGLATKDRVSSDFGCGSSFYMAPEQQPSSGPGHRRPYLPSKSDIWSLGIIFLNLKFGRNPWKISRASADPTFAAYAQDPKVLDGMFPELSASALHFLHRVLCIDPNERADCFEAMELLRRIDTIVIKDGSVDSVLDNSISATSSGVSTSSTSSSMSSSLSSMADSALMSLNGSQRGEIFHMEDDYGATTTVTTTSKKMQSSWSSTSSSKSWSDMDDEEEMDFSKPIEFEQQQDAIDFLAQSGFPTLTELVGAMTLPSSASSAIEVQ